MASQATQKHRLLAVGTPLGDDKLLLRRISGREAVGEPFCYELDLLSEDLLISLEDLLGQPMMVRVELEGDTPRYFSGYVSEFAFLGQEDRYAHYQAVMRPWFWFLTRTCDCRIFQNKSVTDIAKQIFGDHGFSDFKLKLNGSYQAREYCVQYRESDFDFLCRLFEEEGIYYYFTHEETKHHLVLADGYSSHSPCPGATTLGFYQRRKQVVSESDYLFEFASAGSIRTGKVTLDDFNFQSPKAQLRSAQEGSKKLPLATFEQYDYPGRYDNSSVGQQRTRVRLEAEQAAFHTASAEGNVRALCAGYLFTLDKHYRADQNCEYLVLETEIDFDNGEYLTTDVVSPEVPFHVRCRLLKADVPYRMPLRTPRPRVYGVQTALVVGPKGEEIYTDKYARVKCQFHWDREGGSDENSSCWIRVGQIWAGKKWGAMYIPRIGHEVIVDFLEGDPDRPLITGRVYNDLNMPPYALPDNQTRSGFKSNSSKGGKGFNELRLEDKKDAEQIFMHAQKDFDTRVLNDDLRWVGNDQHLKVLNKRYEKVFDEHHMIISKTRSSEKTWVDYVKSLLGLSTSTGGHQLEKVEGDKHQTVDGDHNIKIGGTLSIDCGDDYQHKVGAKSALQSGKEIHLKSGKKIVIEAGTEITLKVGSNFIKLSKAGIDIKGGAIKLESAKSSIDLKSKLNVNLQSSANANVKAGAMLNLQSGANANMKAGAMLNLQSSAGINVNTSAILNLKGSLTNINSAAGPAGPAAAAAAAGSAGSGSGCKPEKPKEPKNPKDADNDKAGEIAETWAQPDNEVAQSPTYTSVIGFSPTQGGADTQQDEDTAQQQRQAAALSSASQSGAPLVKDCENDGE